MKDRVGSCMSPRGSQVRNLQLKCAAKEALRVGGNLLYGRLPNAIVFCAVRLLDTSARFKLLRAAASGLP